MNLASCAEFTGSHHLHALIRALQSRFATLILPGRTERMHKGGELGERADSLVPLHSSFPAERFRVRLTLLRLTCKARPQGLG